MGAGGMSIVGKRTLGLVLAAYALAFLAMALTHAGGPIPLGLGTLRDVPIRGAVPLRGPLRPDPGLGGDLRAGGRTVGLARGAGRSHGWRQVCGRQSSL